MSTEPLDDAALAERLARTPVVTTRTGWDYSTHPGDCHPRREGDVWFVCCRECAGTGVFPVPWIDSPEAGRLDLDSTSCVSCKGTGVAIVTVAFEAAP